MNEDTTDRNARFTQTIAQFSKLSAGGRQDFTSRLIGSAKDDAVLLQEIERVMERLETDSQLAICWDAPEVASPPQAAA
jgi:hypothetical protein